MAKYVFILKRAIFVQEIMISSPLLCLQLPVAIHLSSTAQSLHGIPGGAWDQWVRAWMVGGSMERKHRENRGPS